MKHIYNFSPGPAKLDSSVISITAFLILGLASDLLHNHSVVWLMYFLLSDMNE